MNNQEKLLNTFNFMEKSQQEVIFPYEIEKLGIKISVFKNVFSPKYFGDAEYFVPTLLSIFGPSIKRSKFLEIGAGTGLIAIKIAQAGASVTATDINPDAIKNTQFNVDKNKLSKKVTVKYGDIFGAVPGQKFDIIFWNVPFGYWDESAKDNPDISNIKELAKAGFDPKYQYLSRYLKEGFDYLNPSGRLLVGFGPDCGQEGIMDDIAAGLKLKKVILREG
ncbi:MAG: methyltransferase, partial [Proteobacteria bacterium]|nr:methyltransferase [Pseudomonadota bacterium]